MAALVFPDGFHESGLGFASICTLQIKPMIAARKAP